MTNLFLHLIIVVDLWTDQIERHAPAYLGLS